MVGIKGVGGVPEPAPSGPSNVRSRRREEEAKAAAQQDGVAISSAAQEAANVSRLTKMAKEMDTVRAERVRQAREQLDQESFKLPEVLAAVAKQLSKYLP